MPLDEEQVCESRIQHVCRRWGPPGAHRSTRFRGGKAETNVTGYLVLVDRIVFDIRQSQNLMMVLEGKQHCSDFPAFSLKWSVHCKEIQEETRMVTAQKGWRCSRSCICFFAFTCDLIHITVITRLTRGKSPVNYKTDIAVGPTNNMGKRENKIIHKMGLLKEHNWKTQQFLLRESLRLYLLENNSKALSFIHLR